MLVSKNLRASLDLRIQDAERRIGSHIVAGILEAVENKKTTIELDLYVIDQANKIKKCTEEYSK